MEKKQTGGENTANINESTVHETEKERKAREKAAARYKNESSPLDVLNNPYNKDSQYLEDARAIKFAAPQENKQTSNPDPSFTEERKRRLQFMMDYMPIEKTQSDLMITPNTIYESGYGDLYYDKNRKFDPRNLPESLDKERYELNKGANFGKALTMFKDNAIQGFERSLKSWALWNVRNGGWGAELDNTGTFEDVMLNGYKDIVDDPEKADKKFTQEYWLRQVASLGTSVGMGAEMLAEGLLLKGGGAALKKLFPGIAAWKDAKVINRTAKHSKDAIRAEEEAALNAGKGATGKANDILTSSEIYPRTLQKKQNLRNFNDNVSGVLIGVRNAALNYQFNYEEVYNDAKLHGASDEVAKDIALNSALNSFRIEIVASSALNIMQTKAIHSITRSKFNDFERVMNAAVNNRTSIDSIALPSARRTFWKNAGRFTGSMLMEGFEEVMEDGIAMIGREKAYNTDYKRWNALGMSYNASENYSQLVDSFIGGVMGGGLFSGVRTGLDAAMGRTETQNVKKQQKMLGEIQEVFTKTAKQQATMQLEARKKAAELKEKYDRKEDIKSNGKTYSALNSNGDENPEYKLAYEAERKRITAVIDKSARLANTLSTAAFAARAMSIVGGDESSGMVLQNIQNLIDRKDALNTIATANSKDVENALGYFSRINDLVSEIESLDKDGKNDESAAKKKELEELHKESSEYENLLKSIGTVGDVFMQDDGSVRMDKDAFDNEKELVEEQLFVTNMFNHSFYTYYGNVNDDVDAAIRHATNTAQMAINNMHLNDSVENILSYLDNIFRSATLSNESYFGDRKNKRDEKLRKLAFAYNLFRQLNTGGQYDFVIDTIVSGVASMTGRVIERKQNETSSVLSVENISEKAFNIDEKNELDTFKKYISEYDVEDFDMMGDLVRLSSLRDTVTLFQDIFSDEKGRYAGIRDVMTVDDYDNLFNLMKDGNYGEMVKLCDRILDDAENKRVRSGKLFVEFLKENRVTLKESKEKYDEILKEIADLKKVSKESVLESLDGYGEEEIGDQRLTEVSGDELADVKRKRSVRSILEKAVAGDESYIAELKDSGKALDEAQRKAEKSTPEYSRAKEIADRANAELKQLNSYLQNTENLSGEDSELSDIFYSEAVSVCKSVLERYGLKKLPLDSKFVEKLPLPDDFKEKVWGPVAKLLEHTRAKSKVNGPRNDAMFSIVKKLLEQESVEPVISEKEQESLDEANKNLMDVAERHNIIEEASRIYNAIVDKENNAIEKEKQLNEDLDALKKRIDDAEKDSVKTDDWKQNTELKKLLDDLREEYDKPRSTINEENPADNVKRNAFTNQAYYHAFFNTANNNAVNSFGAVRREAMRARANIESSRNLERYNAELRTGRGVITFNMRRRYYELMEMPESTLKEAKRKRRKLRRLMRECYFQRRLLSPKDGTLLWNDVGASLLMSWDEINDRISALENNIPVVTEENAKRERDLSATAETVNETDEYDEDEYEDASFDIDKAEKDTVYYAEGNEEVARLVSNETGAANVVAVPADTVFLEGRSEKVIYKDLNGNVRYFGDDAKETGMHDTDPKETEPPAEVTPKDTEENKVSGKKPLGMIFGNQGDATAESGAVVTVTDEDGKTKQVPLMLNIILALSDAEQQAGDFFGAGYFASARTENKTLVSYIADKLFGGSTAMADSFIRQMRRVMSLGSIEKNFFKKLVFATGNDMFWDCAGSYAIALFDDCRKPNDVLDIFNNFASTDAPTANWGQDTRPVMASVSGSVDTQQRNVASKEAQNEKNKKKYDIKPKENAGKYDGETGITVNQLFNIDEENGVVTATLFNESGSVITEESIKELEKLGQTNGKGHMLSLPDGIEAVIRDNISLTVNGNGTLFLRNLENRFHGIAKKIKGNISKGKKWDNDLTVEQTQYVYEEAEKNAYIMLRSSGHVVGVLPHSDAWSFNDVKIQTEHVKSYKKDEKKNTLVEVGLELYTDSVCERHEKRVAAMNENLNNLRGSVINGTAALQVDATLTRSNLRGKQVAHYTGTDDIPSNFASTKKGHGSQLVMDESYRLCYAENDGVNRQAVAVMPGRQNYDGNIITTISNTNMANENFMLSKTAPEVFADTKARIQKAFADILAFLSQSENGKTIIRTLLADPKYNATIKNVYGIDGFDDGTFGTKSLNDVLATLNGLFVTNTGKIREAKNQWTKVPFLAFGSDTRVNENKAWATDEIKQGEGLAFYLGPILKNKNGIEMQAKPVVINGSITVDDVKALCDMMIGDDSEMNLNALTIPWTAPGFGWTKTGVQLRGKEKLATGIDGNFNLVLEDGKLFWDSVKNRITVPIGSFDVDLGNGKKADIQMKYARYNMEFGNPVSFPDESDPESLAPSQGGRVEATVESETIVFNDNLPSPKQQQTQKTKEENKNNGAVSINEGNSDVSKIDDYSIAESAAVVSEDLREWMPDMQSLDAWMSGLLRIVFNRCRKDGVSPNNITLEMLSDKLYEYLSDRREKFFKEHRDFVYSALVLRYAKEYTMASSIADEIVKEYPFLDKEEAEKEAQKYLDNKESYKIAPPIGAKGPLDISSEKLVQVHLNDLLSVAKLINPKFQELMFNVDDGLFQQYISDYLQYEKLYVLDEDLEKKDLDTNVDDDGNIMDPWTYNDENTTPFLTGMTMQMRLLFSTLPMCEPDYKDKKLQYDSNGVIKCKQSFPDKFCRATRTLQCYDLGEVINLLTELGKRNKGYTYDSLVKSVKELASTDNQWTGLAVSLYNALATINDPAMIQQINYKLNDMEASNFIYVDERTFDENRYLNINYSVQNTTAGSVLKKMESHAMDVISSEEVYIPFMNKYVRVVRDGRYTDGVDAIVQTLGDKLYANEDSPEKSHTSENHINHVKNWAMNKHAMSSESVKLIQQFLQAFTGWQFDTNTIASDPQAAFDAIRDIQNSCKKGDTPIKEFNKKNNKKRSYIRTVASYMSLSDRRRLQDLVHKDMDFNLIPESRAIKTGGKNVQAWTQRTMATKRLYEMQDKNSAERKDIDESLERTKKESTEYLMKTVCWPQYSGIDDVERGLFDITAYRTNGRVSKKITELAFTDQVYIRTQAYFGYSRNDHDIYMKNLHETAGTAIIDKNGFSMTMRRVPDFTDSNKTKSGYWMLPCIKKPSVEDAVTYMRMSLFDNEIRRIFSIIENGNVRAGEKLIHTCPSYNLIEVTDIDGKVVTLAKFLDGIDSSNISIKWNAIKRQYNGDSETKGLRQKADDETRAILDKYCRDLCGMGINDTHINAKEIDKLQNSAWGKSGMFVVTSTDGKKVFAQENVIGTWQYYLEEDEDYKDEADAKRRMLSLNAIKLAAVDFAVNDIVSKMFILNKMYAGGYEFARKKYAAVNVNDNDSLQKGLINASNALRDATYKRMAGVLTGGNPLDYTGCYKDSNGNKIEKYKDWGGVNHDEFLYLACDETDGQISENFEYYGRLYCSDRYDETELRKSENRVSIWEKHKPGTKEPWFSEPGKYMDKIQKYCPDLMAYASINSTDGQEYCTWREAVDTMFSKAKLSGIVERDAMRAVYEKLENGEILSDDERSVLQKSMQVFKMVYCGISANENAGTHTDYVKSSVCPLLPQFTIGNSRLDGIRKAMEALERQTKRNVHLAFKSAIKVGGVTKANVTFDEISKMGANGDITGLENSCFTGYRKYLSIQNETDTKVHTKTDKKNSHKDVLVSNSRSFRLKNDDGNYNSAYSVAKMIDDFSLDMDIPGTMNAISDLFADVVSKKTKLPKTQTKREILRILSSTDDFSSLGKYLSKRKCLFVDKNTIKELMNGIQDRRLVEIAYRQVYDEGLLANEKEHDKEVHTERVKRLQNLSTEQKEKLFGMEEGVLGKYMDSFEGVYRESSELADDFIDDYMNNAENVELTTVELTQFQHLALSGGISKMKNKVFEVNLNDMLGSVDGQDSTPLRKYLESMKIGETNMLETMKSSDGKSWSHVISGVQLEALRNGFEIIEVTNDILRYLHDDLRIINDKTYNSSKDSHVIPQLSGLIDNDSKVRRIKAELIKELKQRGSDSSSIEMLLNNMPLFMNPDVTKIENLLMSIVRKRASRSYMNGTSLFLMSSHGFEQNKEQNGKLKVVGDEKLMKTEGVVWTDSGRKPGKLRAMSVSEDGKKLFMAECAIAPQFTFFDGESYRQVNFREEENGYYKYLCDSKGQKVKPSDNVDVFLDTKKVDPKLLEIISLRVPTSGLMNVGALKIVAFLPNSMGGMIMVPQDHIAQFGEDFDIDKRFCYMYGYYIDNDGNIKRVTDEYVKSVKDKYLKFNSNNRYKELVDSLEYSLKSNRKMDIYMSIMKCRDKEVQKHLCRTLEWIDMTNTRNAIVQNELYKSSDLRSLPHTMLNQTELSVKSSGSLKGVGVWADCGTFNAILSKENVVMTIDNRPLCVMIDDIDDFRRDDRKETHDSLLFTGNLSKPNTIKHRNDIESTKIQVISEEIQVNVDSVKEDITPHINENPATYQFFTMMAIMGFKLTRAVRIPVYDGKKFVFSKDDFSDAPLVQLDLKSMIAKQPAVVALTDDELFRKSVTNPQYMSSKDILIGVLKRLGISDKEIELMENGSHGIYEITENGVLQKRFVVTSDKNGKEYTTLDYGKDLTGQHLYFDHVRDIDTYHEGNFVQRQLAALSFFTTIRNYGNMLQKYKSLFTVSSSGVGKLYFDIYDKIETLNELAKKGNDKEGIFRGLTKTIGEFWKKSDTKKCPPGAYDIVGLDYYIKPTTVEGNIVLASLQMANSILGTAMGYMEPGMRSIIDSVRNLYSSKEIYNYKKQQIDRRLVKDLSSYILLYAAMNCKGEGVIDKSRYKGQSLGNIVQLERIRLIEAERKIFAAADDNSEAARSFNEITGANMHDFQISEDNNFFKTVNLLRTSHQKYKNTPLMSSIVRVSDDTFGFRIDENSPYAVRRIQHQLMDMFYRPQELLENGYSTRDFVKDFIAMAIVMDDKQGINSFRNIIPVQILKDLGMLKSMKIAVEEMRSGHIDPFRFVEQFVFNNSTDLLTYVSDYSKVAKGLSYSTTNNVGQLSNGDSFMIEYDSDKSLEDALKDRGIFNKKRDGSFPWLVMFRAKNGKYNYIYKYNAEKSRVGVLVYDVMVVEGRNETGRNYYNPFLDPKEALEGSSKPGLLMKRVALDNYLAPFKEKSEKDDSREAFDTMAQKLSKGHNDPVLKLLESALNNNVLGDVGLKLQKEYSDKAYIVQVHTSYGLNAKYSLMFNTNPKYRIDPRENWDTVMHEEMFHLLVSGYLSANAQADGNMIKLDPAAEKRLGKTLTHFYNLRDYYRKSGVTDNILKHIFDNEHGVVSGFNEFIANIMSASNTLSDFIKKYEEDGLSVEKKNRHGIMWEIVDSIVDFIKYICQISEVHKDVAEEVESLLYDMYISDAVENMSPDVENVMKLYGQTMKNLHINNGAEVVRTINTYKPEHFGKDEASVTEFSNHGLYGEFNPTEDMIRKMDIGTFFDKALRAVFAAKNHNEAKHILEHFKNPDGLKGKYNEDLITFTPSTIERIIDIVKNIKYNGGIEKIYHYEIPMVSKFQIDYGKGLKHLSGKPDIIIVDKSGEIHVIDIKSHQGESVLTREGVNKALESHIRQLWAYKEILSEITGEHTNAINGYVLEINYNDFANIGEDNGNTRMQLYDIDPFIDERISVSRTQIGDDVVIELTENEDAKLQDIAKKIKITTELKRKYC